MPVSVAEKKFESEIEAALARDQPDDSYACPGGFTSRRALH